MNNCLLTNARRGIACAAMGLLLVLSASCGTEGSSPRTTVRPTLTPAIRAWAMAYAQCMRAHGIPAPDPSFTPLSITMVYPRSVDPNTPGFRSADLACGGSRQAPPPGYGIGPKPT